MYMKKKSGWKKLKSLIQTWKQNTTWTMNIEEIGIFDIQSIQKIFRKLIFMIQIKWLTKESSRLGKISSAFESPCRLFYYKRLSDIVYHAMQIIVC